mmetsp:Transcript_39449/g.72783  ORF Transcript_39449/g.72783 Transcript_39449/m.72783 type:complete len:105 (+) Transcript_39449:270-584(+)
MQPSRAACRRRTPRRTVESSSHDAPRRRTARSECASCLLRQAVPVETEDANDVVTLFCSSRTPFRTPNPSTAASNRVKSDMVRLPQQARAERRRTFYSTLANAL